MERLERPADDERRLAVARRLAQWELGDGAWANRIIGAYFDPEPAAAWLKAEMT